MFLRLTCSSYGSHGNNSTSFRLPPQSLCSLLLYIVCCTVWHVGQVDFMFYCLKCFLSAYHKRGERISERRRAGGMTRANVLEFFEACNARSKCGQRSRTYNMQQECIACSAWFVHTHTRIAYWLGYLSLPFETLSCWSNHVLCCCCYCCCFSLCCCFYCCCVVVLCVLYVSCMYVRTAYSVNAWDEDGTAGNIREDETAS
jgi:hypothetical protein